MVEAGLQRAAVGRRLSAVGRKCGLVAVATMAWVSIAAGGCLVSGGEESDWEQRLRPFESLLLERRAGQPADERRRGAEPRRLVPLGTGGSVVLLRHTSEAVLLDASLREVDRIPVPRSPASWTVVAGSKLLIGGELSHRLLLVDTAGGRLTAGEEVELESVVAVRDLLLAGRRLFVLDDFQRRLVVFDFAHDRGPLRVSRRQSFEIGAGAQRLLRVGEQLLVNLQHEQRLLLLPLSDPDPDSAQAVEIGLEGPLFDVGLARWGGARWIVAGGIEDRPLDRSGGEFGYVDSFLFLIRPEPGADGLLGWNPAWRADPDRFVSINLSEQDVVTPKAILPLPGEQPALWVAGFGSARLVLMEQQPSGLAVTRESMVPPGIAELQTIETGGGSRIVAVNPLADAVVALAGDGRTTDRWQAPDPVARDPEEKLGELLLFTTLMAPRNSAAGALSRLSCEACHLDGGIDGRIHFTGRADVHATTKTLRGMFDNVPLFSRGGDPDFASMVPAEFDAVNQERASDFVLSRAEQPWLRDWPGVDPVIGPLEQRRALLAFLAAFDHRPNPWRLRQGRLDPTARAGLAVFRDRCEHCHQARTTNRRRSPVPFSRWAEWLEGERDLIWGAPFFSRTGIEPYVDKAGARVPSLRRVWVKSPYFTNGSSSSMGDVLERFRYRDYDAWHHWDGTDPEPVRALAADERRQLEALLRYF